MNRKSLDGRGLLPTLLAVISILVPEVIGLNKLFECFFKTGYILDIKHEVHEVVISVALKLARLTSYLTPQESSENLIKRGR